VAAVNGGGRFRDLSELPPLLETDQVAGLSVAFTVPSGTRAEAFGVTVTGGTSLTPDVMLQAGSVSKAVTAYAAYRLAAQGCLDLDVDVNEVLTSWRLPRVGQWQPAVSVRGLLAHVAGVGSGWGEGTARGEPVPSLLEVLAGTADTPPVMMEALPGLGWAYSGGGYLIVAQVICDITGLAFDEAMAELVLDPVGMTGSTFVQPLPALLEDAAARGHHGREPVPGGWRNQPGENGVPGNPGLPRGRAGVASPASLASPAHGFSSIRSHQASDASEHNPSDAPAGASAARGMNLIVRPPSPHPGRTSCRRSG
jgi:CubicO group peptidase (beta-lactamase class C family)